MILLYIIIFSQNLFTILFNLIYLFIKIIMNPSVSSMLKTGKIKLPNGETLFIDVSGKGF